MRSAIGILVAAFALLPACKSRRAPEPAIGSAPAPAALREAACRSTADCRADQLCRFSPGLCGQGERPGTCQPRRTACPAEPSPVCGCDAKVYDSECAAHAAGVDLAANGGCQAMLRDWAACGPRYCDAHTSYCEIYLSDVFELPGRRLCRPLPPTCLPHDDTPPDCTCFPPSTPCLSFCGPLPTAGLTAFHLTCQGVKEPHEPGPTAR